MSVENGTCQKDLCKAERVTDAGFAVGTHNRKSWGLWEIALLGLAAVSTLLSGLGGGVRDAAAAAFAVVAIICAAHLLHTLSRSRLLHVVTLVAIVMVSPWLFGVVANTLHGWQDHVWFWGRGYNASRRPPGQELVAATPVMSTGQLVAGSTWLPWPGVVAGADSPPMVLIVRGRTVGTWRTASSADPEVGRSEPRSQKRNAARDGVVHGVALVRDVEPPAVLPVEYLEGIHTAPVLPWVRESHVDISRV